MAITIEVTEADIEAGVALSCDECPVAIAASRATGDECRVQSIDWALRFCVGPYSIPAPWPVQDFVREFDHGDDLNKVKPFRFTIDNVGQPPWEEQCYGCEELFFPADLDDEGYCKTCQRSK